MKLNKVILAGINLSNLDAQVVEFAALLSSIMLPEKMVFYHVIDDESGQNKNLEATEAEVREKVAGIVKKQLPENVSFVIEAGNPGELLVKKSKDEQIDLIILGRKISEKNKILTSSLINSSGAALFLIPEQAKPKISNIVIGIDFSEESHNSLSAAVTIADGIGAEVHCLNIYQVPSGYHTSGKEYDEYAEIMKSNAMKAAEKFKKQYHYDVPLNFDFVLDDDSDPADKLYEYAKKSNADLICLGSRGMDSFADLFFDTTAEKIVKFSNHIPMLIVKGKNKNRSLIDAIREL